MDYDNEGTNPRNNDALRAEHERPEDRTPHTLAETLADILDDDDTQPEHFSERVQFAEPSVLIGSRLVTDDERRKLEARIWELETALRILVGLAYIDDCPAEKIIHVGREALEK
jgi:hypothetical protein